MSKHWFVVQTSPRRESTVENAIKGLDFSTLLPLCSWYRHHNHQYQRVVGPLFPCYLFAEFDVNQDPWVAIIRAHGQDGARTILGMAENSGTPQPVPVPVIEGIRRLIDAHHGEVKLKKERKQHFKRNDAVRILNGPFTGMTAWVERDQNARVRCLLDMLGAKVKVSFPRESIALAAAVA